MHHNWAIGAPAMQRLFEHYQATNTAQLQWSGYHHYLKTQSLALQIFQLLTRYIHMKQTLFQQTKQ